jgi:hypothetical protein
VGRPCLHRQQLFVATGAGRLHRLDPETGQVLGPPFSAEGPLVAGPVGWEGLILAGANDGYLYVVEAETGKLLWKYSSGAPITTSPVVMVGGLLILVDRAGRVSALRGPVNRVAPQTINQHFYGPFIGRDGVIINRGLEIPVGGRALRLQSDEAAVEINRSGRPASPTHCPDCNRPIWGLLRAEPETNFCPDCGARLGQKKEE